MITRQRFRVTLVCEVLDNFGDAGISWRLACQLADEWHADVTIAIDQAELLDLWQEQRNLRLQAMDAAPTEIVVDSLQDYTYEAARPDLLIAMLGSTVPAVLRSQMLAHRVAWVRYEYLTAEAWIDDFHACSSVKPDDGMTEWFYYPGYTAASGGLLRERDLLAELNRFTAADTIASEQRVQWLRSHDLDSPTGDFRVCLFGYAEPATQHFVDALLASNRPVTIFISESLAKGLALNACDPRLRLHSWLDQPDFDRLLASCDLNIVRGEDSWLRAQWTGQSMIWQPYRQAGAKHLVKLAAYLDRLLADADPAAAVAIRQAMLALNSGDGSNLTSALTGWFAHLDKIRRIHHRWRDDLARQSPLSERLLAFCRDHLQLPIRQT